MMPYGIAIAAQSDLDQIYDYIAAHNRAAAVRVITVLHERFLLLSTQPFLGEECSELLAGLRRFSVENYVVYYRIVDDTVSVIRVLHGARSVGDTL